MTRTTQAGPKEQCLSEMVGGRWYRRNHEFQNKYTKDSRSPGSRQNHNAFSPSQKSRPMRKKMWDDVPGGEHRTHRIFPWQARSKEQKFVLHGTVTYSHHDGNSKDMEWAGRGAVAKEGHNDVYFVVSIEISLSRGIVAHCWCVCWLIPPI